LPRDRFSLDSSFNPRARAGRDNLADLLGVVVEVSIHAPARGATELEADRRVVVEFQSTRPRGARLAGKMFPAASLSFNPRARAGRDPGAYLLSLRCETFQSTRPRGARPEEMKGETEPSFVSIHAPARGATLGGELYPSCLQFQSTRPRGARPDSSCRGLDRVEVSIHAPARGATPSFQGDSPANTGFNPRARAGRDRSAPCTRCPCRQFQSTRPRGARLPRMSRIRPARMFQSTRPRGARHTANS